LTVIAIESVLGDYCDNIVFSTTAREKAMITITAAEANRHFSGMLRQVGQGAEVLVLSRGKAVAKVVPVNKSESQQQTAKQSLLTRLSQQQPSQKARDWTRDELYD
jgi:prevent-host-death family protein